MTHKSCHFLWDLENELVRKEKVLICTSLPAEAADIDPLHVSNDPPKIIQ